MTDISATHCEPPRGARGAGKWHLLQRPDGATIRVCWTGSEWSLESRSRISTERAAKLGWMYVSQIDKPAGVNINERRK